MAESGSHNLGFRLDINQILSEAQHRWLRPAEICEILRNYQKFHVTPEPPHMPISGSVFLFDRKVLRYFRKDGHNWRKKKDGKTVKEAHEKLKVGSVDMLHCYYAHGEDNENFQRRSYWMLEQDLMHIVFVHYLDVKGNKTNANCLLDTETVSTSSHYDSSHSFSSSPAPDNLASTYTDMTSPTSTLTSAYEDAESVQVNAESNHRIYPGYHSYPEASQQEGSRTTEGGGESSSYSLLQNLGTLTAPSEYIPTVPGHVNGECDDGHFVSDAQRTLDLESWGDVLGSFTAGESAGIHGSWNFPELHSGWKGQINQNSISSSAYDCTGNFVERQFLSSNLQNTVDPFYTRPEGFEEDNVHRNYQKQLPDTQIEYLTKDKTEKDVSSMGAGNCPRVLKQSPVSGLQQEEGLKKVDSFSRWMSKELGEVNELQLQPNNGYSWNEIETEDVVRNSCMPGQLQLDTDTLNFSLSQDQLFSISDFSPNWAYCKSGTEVLITGRFLKYGEELFQCKWSCMFGEVEVEAKVLADGVLCCHAPPHKAGVVPFYVSCSNRLACSEVREFEYRHRPEHINEMRALERLDMLISRGPISTTISPSEIIGEKREMVNKIISLMEEDSSITMKILSGDNFFVSGSLEEQQGEVWLKEKFFSWLISTVTEEGRGPTVLDDEGQGVLHLAAALGFNWALKPITVSGVSIDFRDINGWTALHWAAFCGREDTVAALVSLGAASGALTDPSAEYTLGRTPADLASANGYKGISGFLAECSLTSHLKLLNVKDSEEDHILEGSEAKAIQTISERVPAPMSEEDVPDTLSLKDSLAAVRNATQAAARIHQIFRIHSFQRKMLNLQGKDEPSSSEEHALSLLSSRRSRLGEHNTYANAAATRIQKKFRGYKKRKEFLMIRERIVMIQAHVRGHQARKRYKPIIWSVGILEKVILRWRRKGSGLRGFQGPSTQDAPLKEADDDFLKEGRKQSEERMQKALNRVKSMVQYPEARAQYRRLLNVAEGLRETQSTSVATPSGSENTVYPDEELFDVENLLDDDTFMAMAME